jgi:hypothetical protein
MRSGVPSAWMASSSGPAGKPSGAQGAQMPRSPHSPLRSPYRERYEKALADGARGVVTFDPTALCLPPGMPRMMAAMAGEAAPLPELDVQGGETVIAREITLQVEFRGQ